MPNTFKPTNGHPCWLQIPAYSIPRAVEFYKSAINLEIRGLPDDLEADEAVAHFSFPGGPLANCLTGGIVKIPTYLQEDMRKNREHLLSGVYFYVDDLEAAVERVAKAGGLVIRARSEVGGGDMGWCADFKDTEGNFHGLYTMTPGK